MSSVVLSHSSQDKPFVQELHHRLTRDGVTCLFDTVSIGWGDNWVTTLERALDECEFVVYALSPNFCNSEGVKLERTSATLDRKLRPLILQPCRELPTFPRFLRPIQALDVSTQALFEANYPRLCKELGGIPRNEAVAADRTQIPPVGPLPARHRMPYRSLGDQFIGRVDAFWKLHDSLFRDHTTVLQGAGVIVGTGGLGKTQLAIEYAHRFGTAYGGGVFWVDADRGLGTLIAQVSAAADLQIDAKAEETNQVEQIWRGLNRLPGPSLIILDNFPENAPLRPYLPTTGRVHALITSRRQDLDCPSVLLNVLSTEEGVSLLNSGARRFGAEAALLVERLGGLPLALELAKSYLTYRREVQISELMAEMKAASDLELLAEFSSEYRDQLPSGHEIDIVRTFQMSWQIAPEPARQVLRVMGELAPAGVPRSLLRTILNWPVQSGLRDPLSKALDELSRLSLLEVDTNGNPKAHRLILAFAQYRNVADSASPFDGCRQAIQSQMKRAHENPGAATIRELEWVVPHAEFLLAGLHLSPADSIDLAAGLNRHHRTSGRYRDARRACIGALEIAEKTFEPGHPSIAIKQSTLAVVLQALGQLEEARDLLRKALASDEKTFEPGHPSIVRRQSNLALVLKNLGQLEEARDLLRKALASAEKMFEPGHPSIARSQSNLTTVLQVLGQQEEARDLLREALAAAEKTFEPGHPSIAIRQSNLALVLQDLGQMEEARDLQRKAYRAYLDRFGPDHPHARTIKENLDSVGG